MLKNRPWWSFGAGADLSHNAVPSIWCRRRRQRAWSPHSVIMKHERLLPSLDYEGFPIRRAAKRDRRYKHGTHAACAASHRRRSGADPLRRARSHSRISPYSACWARISSEQRSSHGASARCDRPVRSDRAYRRGALLRVGRSAWSIQARSGRQLRHASAATSRGARWR